MAKGTPEGGVTLTRVAPAAGVVVMLSSSFVTSHELAEISVLLGHSELRVVA